MILQGIDTEDLLAADNQSTNNTPFLDQQSPNQDNFAFQHPEQNALNYSDRFKNLIPPAPNQILQGLQVEDPNEMNEIIQYPEAQHQQKEQIDEPVPEQYPADQQLLKPGANRISYQMGQKLLQ